MMMPGLIELLIIGALVLVPLAVIVIVIVVATTKRKP
jgi:hypothetical protein